MATAVKEKVLTTKEKLLIITNDPKLWLKNFVRIVDNYGDLVPFILNEQQEEFADTMTKFNVIGKPRQVGFTTLSLGLCLHYACTKPNTQYLIVSYKKESSDALFERLKGMYDRLPHERIAFPLVKRNNRGEFLLDNNSRITCVVAGNKDIGRGDTFEYILLSEFAFYQNQDRVILSAEQALSKNKNSKVVIETTSNGFNHYQKLFMKAYKKDSKYKAFFFPFYCSAYKKQFKFDHDQAEEWYKLTNKGARLSEKELEKDEKALFDRGCNLRILMWRRWKLQDMTPQQFYQEYPSNPMESFISTGHGVFDQSKLVDRIPHVLPAMSRGDVLSNEEFPEILKPYVGKVLNIYHLPKEKRKYYGGVDTASGSGGDDSTILMLNEDGDEVCSFKSNTVPVYTFAEIVDAVGRYFGYAFLVVERNSYGLPLLERLRKEYNYLNLYKHKIFNDRGKKIMQLGWLTSNTSKSIMVSDYKEQFEVGLININSTELLEQMQIFVEVETGKTGNKKGSENHDDLVIAAALAVQGMKTSKWYVDV